MKCRVVFAVVSLVALSLILASCGGGSSPATTAIAYVAHSQSHSLSVINIPADKTVSSIEIGNSSVGSLNLTPSYPTGVALTPDGSRAYVTDASTSVWVVDTGSKSVIAKIAAGSGPEAIAITPDGKTAYVNSITCGLLLCSGPDNPPQLASVEVVDTASNSLTATITIGNLPGQTPGVLLAGIAISPDGNRAYVSNAVGNQIWGIDTVSNQVVAMIPTAALGFVGVSMSPDGSHVYAAGWETGFPVVDVIDTKTDAVVASVVLPSDEVPTDIAVTPNGSYAYVTGDNGHVWVVDTMKNAVTATISVSVGSPLLGIAMGPDASRAYVTCGNNNAIYTLDTTTNTVVGKIPSDYPGGLAVTPVT